MKVISFLIILCILNVASIVYSKEIPFTQDDRDRLIRVEIKLDEGYKSLQRQIEEGDRSLQRQIDDLKTFMLWGYGILFGGMGILIGFVIWDRRTALAPAIKKTLSIEEREERIEKALKDLAKEDGRVAKALKNAGLL